MPKAAADLAAQYGAKVATVDEIMKARDVDAVLIGSPTGFHAEQIQAASHAGKAIMCEKPVSLSVATIHETLKVVEKNKSTLMIGFNRRFDPNFAELEARIRKGAVGNVELVTVISRDPAPPPVDYVKGSGGLFRDMMIHDFDMARFLMGEEFALVQALGASLVDPEIGKAGDVDTAAVQMQTASGRIAVITNSRRATYGYDQRIEVHGVKGMLTAGNIRNTTVELHTGGGSTEDPLLNFFTERYAAAYANELNTFIAAVDSGKKDPRPNGFDGLKAQMLADAATESWKTGKPVKV
jgi:myo-inositol 2-dehydrogenase/D-chiro-inositol 1-dehydrogenase